MAKFVLLGDSIAIRLFKKFRSDFHFLSETFSISGATIESLTTIVRDNRNLLKGQSVFVMIGTNNLLNFSDIKEMKKSLRILIRFLGRLSCTTVLSDIISSPRISQNQTSSNLLDAYNKYIWSFETGQCQVLHMNDCFKSVKSSHKVLFCHYYGSSNRIDQIHPNSSGLVLMRTFILRYSICKFP